MEEKNSEAAEGSDTANKLECAICLQPSVQPVQLPCRHIFCYLCVKGATQQSKRCAMCRREIPLNYLDNPQLIAVEEPTVAFEGTYQWFYEGRNGWWRYDSRTSVEIENAYKKGEPQCEVLIAGFLYIIDFEKNLQYRRYDPYRRRRIKRDLVNIPIKGIAGIRVDDNEVSTSNDNEAVCSSSSDNSSNTASQGKLAEFLKLRAEIYAEMEEEERQRREEEEEQQRLDEEEQQRQGLQAPANHCCESKSKGSSGCGSGVGAQGSAAPSGSEMGPGNPSGPMPGPMGPSMNTGMTGLPAGGCHSGWGGFPIPYGPQGVFCPGYSGWGCGPGYCGPHMAPPVSHCGQPGYTGSGCHSPMCKPAPNAPAPVIVNNFFGPTMSGPPATGPGPAAMPAGEQTGPPPPGMGTYPQEPSNFGPVRTGFCAGCSAGTNSNNVAENCTAHGTSNAHGTPDNTQSTKTTGQNQGYLPYRHQATENASSISDKITTANLIDSRIRSLLSGEHSMLHPGNSLDAGIINEVMRLLEKSTKNNLPKEYFAFLDTYASICGQGFGMCGPASSDVTKENKVEYMTSIQQAFEYCFEGAISKEEMKHCWFVAQIDQGNKYYINFSDAGKGYLYSIDDNKKSEYFAKDFSEFFKKFFEIYDVKKANS